MNHAQLALSAANPGLLPMAIGSCASGARGYKASAKEIRYDRESMIVVTLALSAMCGLAFLPYTGLI